MKSEMILGGFRKRNIPLNADYRPMYKVGLIICILKKASIGSRASLSKLHFLIWAMKSIKNMDLIKRIIHSGNTSGLVSWGVEPALNKALSLGVAEGLFELKGDKYIITNKAEIIYSAIQKDDDLFTIEKGFLDYVGKKSVTEGFIVQLTNSISK